MSVSALKYSGSMANKLLAYLFLLFFMVGCGSVESDENSRSQAEPKPTSPQVTLTSSQETVAMNGSVTLTWDSANVSSCASSNNWSGSNAIKGSRTISGLTSDKVFSLSCIGVGGTATVEASVSVLGSPVPTVTVSASPVNLTYSGSTQLSWTSSNANNCMASGDWSGNKSTSGSTSFSNLLSGKTYNLTCTGPGGSASDSVRITVAGPVASSVNLTASPSSLPFNGASTLSWSSNNATGCAASGDWSGSKATSGSQTISALTSNRVFILSCSGPGGTASDTVNITVAAPSPTLTLSANSGAIAQNGSTTLSWNSTDTTSCTASGDWSGNKAVSGSQTISGLTSDSLFMLTCSGAGGSVNDTVSVTVAASAPTLSFSANPGSVAQNGSTTLSWNSTDATSCTASGDWSGNKAASGSQTISGLTANSLYMLTCSGAGGSVNDTVSVTVAAPAPTLSFSASPGSVSQNGSTTLSWNSTDATSCTASGDWSGNKATSGSESTGSLTIDSQYTLTCTGAGGSVNESVNVTVVLSNNGTALLSWTPPTENTDGSLLTDLAGYKIRYGTSPGNYSDIEVINDPGLTSFMIEDLASADWYFVMTSFNSSGIESGYSTEVNKTIP